VRLFACLENVNQKKERLYKFVFVALGLWDWLINLAEQLGYIGVFLISFAGAASIIIPIPYTFVIGWLGMNSKMDPLLLTVAGGLGSGIGEISGYILGYYGRSVIGEERQRKMNYMMRIIDRFGSKKRFIAIFLFALTPLPDDLLFIPLGILRYSLFKAFIPCLLGKLLMCSILAYGGRLFREVLQELLGELPVEVDLLTSAITAITLVVILVAMFKIDWEKVFAKYMGGGSEKVEGDS